MHFGHDISRPVSVSEVEAGVEQLEDGEFAAWAEFNVDEDVWATYEAEVVAVGAPGGMSISFTGPMVGRSLASESALVVAADGHHFDEEEIDAAVAILRQLGTDAGGEVLYQFSFEPIAKVIIDVVWPVVASLGPNIVASAIYDAARSFFRPGRQGLVFNVSFKETRRGTRKVKVHIEASNEVELRAAIDGLPKVLESGTQGTFVSRAGSPLELLASEAQDRSLTPWTTRSNLVSSLTRGLRVRTRRSPQRGERTHLDLMLGMIPTGSIAAALEQGAVTLRRGTRAERNALAESGPLMWTCETTTLASMGTSSANG